MAGLLRTELACGELPRVPGADLLIHFFDCSAARARVVEDDRKFRVDGCCTEPFRPELVRVCRCLTALARLAEDDWVFRAARFGAELPRLTEDAWRLRFCFCCGEPGRPRVLEEDRDCLTPERCLCLEAVCRAADFWRAALEDFEDLDCPTATFCISNRLASVAATNACRIIWLVFIVSLFRKKWLVGFAGYLPERERAPTVTQLAKNE